MSGQRTRHQLTHTLHLLLICAMLASPAIGSAQPAPAAPITATLSDTLVGDLDGDGGADPGDTIEYTATIQNTGSSDLNEAGFSAQLDPNLTLVPGSLRVSPIARADSYVTLVDTALAHPAVTGVLANDSGIPPPSATIFSGATSQGGTVAIAADGSFSYTPPGKFSGSDSFSYTATNSRGSAGTTVTITVEAAPAVALASPADGAADIAPASNLVISFSEPVSLGGAWFQIDCATSGTRTVGDTTVSGGPSVYTIDPTSDFASTETCTVTIAAAQVSDTDTNDPPDQMTADYSFSFNTIDPAPAVISTSPSDGAPNVATNANLTITFNEPVNLTAGAFALTCNSSSVAFTNTTGAGPASSFTLDPTSDLAEDASCTVSVAASQVTDNDPIDPPDQMAADYSFDFTVDATPSVTAITPANGAANVATDTTITISFSEPVNITGGAITIECPTGNPISFSGIPAGPASSVTLDPTANLPAATTCTITVGASISDADAGDPPDTLAAAVISTFTTDAPPSVTATTPANGATTIGVNDTITISFSELVNITAGAFAIACPTGNPVAVTNTTGSGPASSFTLDPTNALPQGVTCTITVSATHVTDNDSGDPPDQMAADYVFSFSTDSAPTVTGTTPANGATNVGLSSNLTVNFSENVSFTGAAFTLECPVGASVAFSVSGSGTSTATIDPTGQLPTGASCRLTIDAAQVTDTDSGDPPDTLDQSYAIDFNVIDDTAPTVTGTTPANGATIVATSANITVSFSEPVNVTAGAFAIACPTGNPVAFTNTTGAGPASSFMLDPPAALPEGITCTVTVSAAQVTDDDAIDPPNQMAVDYSFSFITDAAPSVTGTTPANGAATVATSANITVNFSEPVNVTASAFALACPTGSPIAVTNTTGSGPASSFTLDPTAALPEGVTCTVTVSATQVTDDDSGDPPDQMAANYVFSFTTDAPPSVTGTTPANGATTIGVDSTITINFSEPVNVTASAFALACPTGSPIAVTNTTGAGPASSFVLDPTAALPEGVTCTVTVSATQVTDDDSGDPPDQMAANYVFSFTTDTQPSVTGVTPLNGATGVNENSNITINFSENVDFTAGAFTLECPAATPIAFSVSGSGTDTATIDPTAAMPPATNCAFRVIASAITDSDSGDPPNQMAADYSFGFRIAVPPPVATNDNYGPVVGNILVTVPDGASDVLANDTTHFGSTITAFAATSANGGTVALNTNGSFTYNPPAGFEGDDTFTYTLTNEGGNSIGTVTITVGEVIWFVDAAAATGGDGRFGSPFDNAGYTAINTAGADIDDPSDVIFFYTGAYTNSIALEDNQRLVGQGTSLSAALSAYGITLSSLQSIGGTGAGTNPTITAATAATLASNNDIRTINLSGTLSGSGAGGTSTVSNLSINSTAAAVNLSGQAGTLTFTNVPITAGGSGAGIIISGGNAAITFGSGAPIIKNGAGGAIDIQNRTGGTITFSSSVTAAGVNGATAINLVNNSGSTTSFSQAIDLTVTGGRVLNVNNGGGVTFGGSGSNWISNTSTQTAVTVTYPSATAGSITIESLNTNDAAGDPAGAVAVNNLNGAFTITGVGTTAASGGSIPVTTADALSFSNVGAISISNMRIGQPSCPATADTTIQINGDGVNIATAASLSISNLQVYCTAGHGLDINGVTGNTTLSGVSVQNAGDTTADNGLNLVQSANATITLNNNPAFTASAGRNAAIDINGGVVSVNVFGGTFSNSSATTGVDGLRLRANNASVVGLTVANSTFSGNGFSGLNAQSFNSASLTAAITAATVQNNGNVGIMLGTSNSASGVFSIANSSAISQNVASEITAFFTGSGSGSLAADGNILSDNGIGTDPSGSGVLIIQEETGGPVNVALRNNMIMVANDFGWPLIAQKLLGTGFSPNRFDLTMTGNTLQYTNPAGFTEAAYLQNGDATTFCADLGNNTFQSVAAGVPGLTLENGGTGTFLLPGYPGGSVQTYLAARPNTIIPSPVNDFGVFTGGACLSPPASLAGASPFAAQPHTDAPKVRAPEQPVANVPAPQSGELVTADLGVFPAGASVTISFQAIVNNPLPVGVNSVAIQGSIAAQGYSAVLTDDPQTPAAGDPTVATFGLYSIALPLVIQEGVAADGPNLTVEQITTTGGQLQIIIRNIGGTIITQPFWVDVYIDPTDPPTAVNQIWQTRGTRGLVWGITGAALPLDPGERLTLTVGDPLYRADLSQSGGPITLGTPIYAQVDSANALTNYGAVNETDEQPGAVYNNILGPVLASDVVPLGATPSSSATQGDDGGLPSRDIP